MLLENFELVDEPTLLEICMLWRLTYRTVRKGPARLWTMCSPALQQLQVSVSNDRVDRGIDENEVRLPTSSPETLLFQD